MVLSSNWSAGVNIFKLGRVCSIAKSSVQVRGVLSSILLRPVPERMILIFKLGLAMPFRSISKAFPSKGAASAQTIGIFFRTAIPAAIANMLLSPCPIVKCLSGKLLAKCKV